MKTPAGAGDPQQLRSPLFLAFFRRVLRRRMQQSFDAVRLARPGAPAVPADLPLIVYCNHPSWWDAALLPVIMADLYPARLTYGPIDNDALQRYRFMRHLGFFGVSPGYAGAATFLRVGRALLARPETLFCITPQGGFADPRARPIRLQPGLAGLITSVPKVTVLPLALEYPHWDERNPEALMRFGTPRTLGRASSASPVGIQQRLEDDLTATMDALAADAVSRDARRFDVLIAGQVGVGGVYDGWRRLRAWSRGKRFDAAHARAGAGVVVETATVAMARDRAPLPP